MTRFELIGMTVEELRKLAREQTDKAGLAIAGAKKTELISWIMGDPEEITPATAPIKSDNLADILAAALQGKISAGIDAEQVREIVQEEIKKVFIPQIIHVSTEGKEGFKDMGIQHKDFEALLKLASGRLDTMLVGPAGSGKTTICHNIADAFELPFYMTSVGQQTTKTDLLGYQDANGNYVKTHLRQAYEFGGLYLMDEIDAGNANVITILNSLLANGMAAFPDAMVKRHKDFIFFAAANTFGRGNDRQYIGRNQLDAASLDRFTVVSFDYDNQLELAISGNEIWTKKIQAMRDKAFDLKLQVVISPRASIKGASLLAAGFSEDEVLDMIVFKGCNADIKAKLLNNF